MKKRRKGLRAVSIAIVLCLAAGGGYYYWRTAGARATAVPAGAIGSNANADTYTVSRMSFSVDISGDGTIKPTTSTAVTAPFAGEIAAVAVRDGDTVKAGDLLFTIDRASIEDKISAIRTEILAKDQEIAAAGSSSTSGSIASPVAGRVKEIYAAKGEDVKNRMAQSGALMMLSADNRMRVEFPATGDVAVTLASRLVAYMEVDGETVEEELSIQSIDGGVVTATLVGDEYDVGLAATIKNMDGVVVGSGVLSVNRPVYVVGDKGVVSAIRYDVGDAVSKGSTLISLTTKMLGSDFEALIQAREDLADDLNEAQAELGQLDWLADQNGVISGVTLKAGDEVAEGDPLYTIDCTDEFEIVVAIDELDITSVAVGQSAAITVPALSNKAFEATVTHISSSGTAESGVTTYDVTLLLSETDGILPGMNAEASVETISRANVLVVPAAAVQSSGGNKLVSVVDGSTTTPTIVTVGASNGTYVEITSGLNEGDVIAYSAGSDGSANANLGMMMMGGDIGGMPGGQMPSGNWSGGTRGSGTRSSGSGDAGSRPAAPGGN